jgi:hypothetical protein
VVGLAALLVGSVVVRTALADKIAAPQLLCDEFIYAGIAKSLATNGHFMLRNEPTGVSFVYPALLAPAWRAGSMETTYFLAKAINSVVMSLAAIPMFFWARRLAGPAWALVATALLLLIPGFNYTGMLMTENAFLTAFLFATFAIASSLERPTALRQLLAVAAVVLAIGVRGEGAALAIALPCAIVLFGALDRSAPGRPSQRARRELGRHRISLGILGGLAVVYVGLRVIAGGGTLTAYGDVLVAKYSLVDVFRSIAYHLEELTLASGIVPFAAFLLLVALITRGSLRPTAAERAFVAVAVVTVVAFFVEIGFYTSRFSGGVSERYTFYLQAIFLLALVSWLSRGLPRPARPAIVFALVAAVLVILFPLDRFTRANPLYNAFGLYPFHRLPARIGMTAGHVELLVSLIAVGVAVAFCLLPRRWLAFAIPLALGVFFVVSSSPVFGGLKGNAFLARYSVGLGGDSSWIEQDLGRDRPVTYLYTETAQGKLAATRTLTQAEFWNRNISWVTGLGATELCPLPEKSGRIDENSGAITPTEDQGPLAEPLVVTTGTLALSGKRIASHPPLVAYRIRQPLHLATSTTGVYSDGWTSGKATYTRFDPPAPGSTLLVDVSRVAWGGKDVPGAVTVRVSALPDGSNPGRPLGTRRWVIHSVTARQFRFRLPQQPFRVEVSVDPTFVPSDYGVADDRPLGAVLGIQVVR